MATGGVGALTVSLGLDAAEFTNGLTKAQQQAKKFADVTASIAAGTAFGQVIYDAAKQAAAGLKEMVFGSIDAADHLNDLSKQTGIAVETLGGIGFAAGQAGGDLESAARAAGKLNKSLAEAASGNKEASEAFQKLGINVKDAAGNTKTADVAMVEIADKFAGFADGPEKSALALKLFGKAGADMIPLLNDGGAALLANIEYFKRYSGVTQEVATQADAFNDTFGKVKLISKSFGTTLAADLLPLLQTMADRFLAAKEQGDGFKGTADSMVEVMKGLLIAGAYVADTFRGIGREIGALAAQGSVLQEAFSDASVLEKMSPALMLKRLTKAFNSAQFTGISEAVRADGERAKAELAALVNDIQHPFDASGFSKTASSFGGGAGSKKPPAPGMSGDADDKAAKEAARKLKAALDSQIKLIEDFGKARADAYRFYEAQLEGTYQAGLISQREFFDTQKLVRDAALAAQLETIDKEIAAQRKYISDPASKGADRVAAEEKVKLSVQQRAEVVSKASAADILASQAEARAVEQLADAYVSLSAEILANSGDTFGADALRNAQEIARAADLINKAGGDRSVVDTLAAQLELRRQATQLQKDYAALLDTTARREAEIYLDAQLNGKTELETLAAIRDARQTAITQLQQQAQAAAALAAQSGTAADLKNAQDLALAFKKASAEIDPLAAKFNAVFEDSFGNAFAGFISGTKSAKDAFKDFASSVIQQIANIAAKNLAQALFGGSGSSASGLGSLFSSFFGGGATTQGGATQGIDFSGTGFPLASGTNYVPRDNFKATLHKGEAVVPAKFNPAAGGARAQGDVYISNYTPAQVQTSRDDAGDLQVVIQEAARRGAALAASQVSSGRGPMAQAMRSRGITLDRSNPRKK